MLYLIPIDDPEEDTSTTYYTISTGRRSSWRKDKKILKQFLTAYGVPKQHHAQVLKDLGLTRKYHATGKHEASPEERATRNSEAVS